MEHKDAVRLNAAEKYVLGELSEAQRDEYEEHYFDCSTCADELKATMAFMESTKQVAREHMLQPVAVAEAARQQAMQHAERPSRAGFFAWLRPAFAASAFACAALLLFIGYQNSVTIPSLKQSLAQAASVKIVSHFSLIAAGARGDGQVEIAVRPDEEFELDVDFPVMPSATGFVGQIQDAQGNIRFAQPVSLEQAKSSVYVNVPGGLLQDGKYNFVILAQGTDAGSGTIKEVKRLPFAVVFRR